MNTMAPFISIGLKGWGAMICIRPGDPSVVYAGPAIRMVWVGRVPNRGYHPQTPAGIHGSELDV